MSDARFLHPYHKHGIGGGDSGHALSFAKMILKNQYQLGDVCITEKLPTGRKMIGRGKRC